MPLQQRKLPRKDDFCYSARETYFLTICAKDKKRIFGRIVSGENFKPPVIELSHIGKIVEKHILSISKIEGVQLEKYVIMPDHIHLLIFVNSEIDDNVHVEPVPTDIIPRVVASVKRFSNRDAGENLFQKSYYDHIIRNQKDYDKHWEYIENNPGTWLDKHGIKND